MPAAPALTLNSLMARFRAVSGLEAHFREEKKMAILAAPLESEGTIYFAAPDRLVRQTRFPTASKLVVDSNELRFGDASGSQAIPLEGNPVVRLFVDAFVKVLAGDAVALQRIFDIELHPAALGWSLDLKPKLAPMTSVIERLRIEGRDVVVDKMIVRETDGDETTTVFSAVDARRRFGPEEKARIFSAP